MNVETEAPDDQRAPDSRGIDSREGVEVPEGQQSPETEAEVCEGRAPRVLRAPYQPTKKQREEHEVAGHIHFRLWCQACVQGRGKPRRTQVGHSRSISSRNCVRTTGLQAAQMAIAKT